MQAYKLFTAILNKGQNMDEKKRHGNPKYYKGLDNKTSSEREKQFDRQSKMHWDDPAAYKEAPGDDKPTRASKWTDIANKRFPKQQKDESEDVNESVIREIIREVIEVMDEDDESLDEAKRKKRKSNVNASLRNKAKSANAPLGALRTIYNKGLAAWRTGHRPGAGQHQWAMARVNSVLAGGPARKVDIAQWKSIQRHRKNKKD
jgi:hypothetical protein